MTEKAFLTALEAHGFTVKPKAKSPYKRILDREKNCVASYDVCGGYVDIEEHHPKVEVGTRIHLPLDLLDDQGASAHMGGFKELLGFYAKGDTVRKRPILVFFNQPAPKPTASRP